MDYDTPLYAGPAVATSAPLAWPGLRVERHRLGAMELPAHAREHHLLLIHQPGPPVTTRRRQGGRVDEAVFGAGDVGLYPGGEYGPVAWDGPADTTHVYVEPRHLEALADQAFDGTTVRLQERFRFEDGLLTHVGRQLLDAVDAPGALGRLYAESLRATLGYHLLTHHATREPRVAAGPPLSAAALARVDAYLEAHADRPVTLAVLAGVAHQSVFHFARGFKRATGVTPYQHVLRWKVRRAQALLRAGDLPVAAVGDALGFASADHFAAAFKRIVGRSPRDFRRG